MFASRLLLLLLLLLLEVGRLLLDVGGDVELHLLPGLAGRRGWILAASGALLHTGSVHLGHLRLLQKRRRRAFLFGG